MNPRVPLVVLVAATCLYCSGAPQREQRTSVQVGGGYVRAGESTFGCGGDLISTQDHRQRMGSLAVEHESESGWSAGAEVAALQGELVSFTAPTQPNQPQLDPTARTQEYTLTAGHMRAGFDLAWIGAELGGSVVSGLGPMPFGLLRAGNLVEGLSAELQAGRRRALSDPTVLAAALAYKAPNLRIRGALAAMARPLQRYAQQGSGLVRDNVVAGSFVNGLDNGLVVDVETWLDDSVALRMGAVLGESWGATVDLVVALTRKVPKMSERWEGRVLPMPGRMPPAPPPLPPAMTGDHPPLAEPVTPADDGPGTDD